MTTAGTTRLYAGAGSYSTIMIFMPKPECNNREAYKLDRKNDGMQHGIPNGMTTDSSLLWLLRNLNRSLIASMPDCAI